MNNELLIKTPHADIIAFLKDGFYSGLGCGSFHNHNCTEVHITVGGGAIFAVSGRDVELKSGDLLLIPPKSLHACIAQDDGVRRTAFQIDREVAEAQVIHIDEHILSGFFDEIERSEHGGDCTMLCAFMSLICCHFCIGQPITPRHVEDHGYTVYEFFSQRYSEDVRLADLAAELHLCERQTERLVTEHMGVNFRKALSNTRIMMAKQLMQDSRLTLAQIAEYVGYRSYAGFWKALRAYDARHVE